MCTKHINHYTFSSKKVTLSCHRNDLDQDVYDGVVTGKSNKSYPVSATIEFMFGQGKIGSTIHLAINHL